MPRPHFFDQVADDIAERMEKEIEEQVANLTQGSLAPFSAPVTREQALAYYAAQFFLPDGSPNVAGRAQLMERLGPVQYAETYRSVVSARRTPREPVAGGRY